MDITLLVSAIQPHQKESLAITTLNFARQLVKEKQEVTIVSRNKWNLPTYEKKEGITFFRTKKKGKFVIYNKLLAFPLAIKKLTKNNNIGVLHSFSAAPVLVLRSLMAKWFFCKKTKVIHTLKSYPIKKDIKAKKGSFLLSQLGDLPYKLLNFVDYVTVPTKVHAHKLIAKGVKKERIRIIRSHIDLNKFYPKNKTLLKEKYGHKWEKIILNYGAMWEIKGTNYLIKSIPKVIKENSNVLFVFAPRNLVQAQEKYLPLIKKLEVEEHVQFIDKEVPIEEYVNLANVVVIPYPHLEGTEGNPSCILEAMACKTPVVTTDLPELREIAGDSIFFAKPRDVESLKEMINYVLEKSNPEMIENAYQKTKNFSVEKVTQEFLELYKEVIKNKKSKKN